MCNTGKMKFSRKREKIVWVSWEILFRLSTFIFIVEHILTVKKEEWLHVWRQLKGKEKSWIYEIVFQVQLKLLALVYCDFKSHFKSFSPLSNLNTIFVTYFANYVNILQHPLARICGKKDLWCFKRWNVSKIIFYDDFFRSDIYVFKTLQKEF